ncbi:MAG: hypothetical protein ACYCSQ_05615 [bacterium]
MASLKVKKIKQSLLKKGFQKRDGNADHTYYHYYTIDKKKTSIYTKISHGEKEIGDNLIGLMSNQLKLNINEFKGLINCPLSREDYEVKLNDWFKTNK